MHSLWGATAIGLAALSGCATQYQGVGVTGGHFEANGPGKLVKVTFSGNGFITADKVQQYAMYRCAEVAQQGGRAHFVIYDSLMAAAAEQPSRQPRVGTLGGKPTAFAFLLPLDAPRAGSLETKAVLAELEPAVRGPSAKAN